MIDALPVGLGFASQLVRRRKVRRLGVIPVSGIGHDQRAGVVVVVDVVVVLPLVSEDGAVTEVVVAGALVAMPPSAGAVVVVGVVMDVVSLVVDVDVGEVVAVVVEPGVALAPELLYPVLAPLLQPGSAAPARARTAM